MATEQVSVTLQAETVAGVRSRVGRRGVSAYLDRSAQRQLARDEHRERVLSYIAELEMQDPSTPEQIEQGDRLADRILAEIPDRPHA